MTVEALAITPKGMQVVRRACEGSSDPLAKVVVQLIELLERLMEDVILELCPTCGDLSDGPPVQGRCQYCGEVFLYIRKPQGKERNYCEDHTREVYAARVRAGMFANQPLPLIPVPTGRCKRCDRQLIRGWCIAGHTND